MQQEVSEPAATTYLTMNEFKDTLITAKPGGTFVYAVGKNHWVRLRSRSARLRGLALAAPRC
jgi:hypothetical protein